MTLTLDADVKAGVVELLASLPGKVSFSELVDDLLRNFLVEVAPMVKQVVAAAPGERVQLMEQLAGQQMLSFGRQFSSTVEHLQALEAVRTVKESEKRKE